MGTQEGSPTEPSQAHSRQVGRGGIGNIQEARKWNVIPADEPPHRFDPNVWFPFSFKLSYDRII